MRSRPLPLQLMKENDPVKKTFLLSRILLLVVTVMLSSGAFNALHTAFCDEKLTGPGAEVAAVISLMGAVGANHIDKNDPPVFIAHGTSDNVAPYMMVKSMVQQLEKVNAEYSFYPVAGVAHRLQTILDTEFDGKTVRDHSLGFCFEAMKLGELIKELR